MFVRWLLATIHLLALGIGLGAIWARARALRGPLDPPGIRRVLVADTWWGIAAGLWIVTGALRAFGRFEKGTDYYLHNGFFMAKMSLLALILLLEIWPMVVFIRWRVQLARGEAVDVSPAAAFARVSDLQAVLVVLMVLAATAMARGLGVR